MIKLAHDGLLAVVRVDSDDLVLVGGQDAAVVLDRDAAAELEQVTASQQGKAAGGAVDPHQAGSGEFAENHEGIAVAADHHVVELDAAAEAISDLDLVTGRRRP
ncbi:MAG TPA: hypothetical protein VIU11_22940 [Nakamurella sp.]